jgi:hypothetical protein
VHGSFKALFSNYFIKRRLNLCPQDRSLVEGFIFDRSRGIDFFECQLIDAGCQEINDLTP